MTKVLRVVGVALGLGYAFWNLHHEYSLKYRYAGSLNMAVWRSLNAAAMQASNVPRITDAELSIPRDPVECREPLTEIELPADCDLFGGDFGGKSRNCPYWWLGRKCYVFYIPEAIYERPALRNRIVAALERPCDVLFDPAGRTDRQKAGMYNFEERARRAFGCNGKLLPIKQEVKLYVIGSNGRYSVDTIVMR